MKPWWKKPEPDPPPEYTPSGHIIMGYVGEWAVVGYIEGDPNRPLCETEEGGIVTPNGVFARSSLNFVGTFPVEEEEVYEDEEVEEKEVYQDEEVEDEEVYDDEEVEDEEVYERVVFGEVAGDWTTYTTDGETAISVSTRLQHGEDRFAYVTSPKGLLVPRQELYILADGAGGHEYGKLAAQSFCEGVLRGFQTLNRWQCLNAKSALRALMKAGHEALCAAAAEVDKPEELVTTAVLLLIQNGKAFYCHLGDSKLLLYREPQGRSHWLRSLTRDHTALFATLGAKEARRIDQAQWVYCGPEPKRFSKDWSVLLTLKEFSLFHTRSQLTRAVDYRDLPEVEVEIGVVVIEEGDRFYLCSDGVHDNLVYAQIEAIIGEAIERGESVPIDVLQAAQEVASGSGSLDELLNYVEREGKLPFVEDEEQAWWNVRAKPDDMTFVEVIPQCS